VPPIPINRATIVSDGTQAGLWVVKDLAPWPKYGDPSLCVSCRIRATPVDEQEWLSNEYLDLAASASDAGIPAGFPMWPLDTSVDDINGPEKWHGFRMRIFAAQVTGLPESTREASGVTAFRLDYGGERELEFLVYQIAIYHHHIAASLIFRCEPERDEVQLEVRNWQQVERLSDLQRLMRGVEVFTTFVGSGRNRDCVDRIRRVIRQFKGIETPSPGEVSRLVYASHEAGYERDAFRQCLKRNGVTFSDLLQQEGWVLPEH
jgi:hypothetical protein